MYFVYVLRCKGSSLYCGYTTDVAHRLRAHEGSITGGARYTKANPPASVECVWETAEKADAMRLEYFFKRLKKAEKEALVSGAAQFDEVFGERLDAAMFTRRKEFECQLSE